MKLDFKILCLRKKYPFTISGHTTTVYPVVFVQISHEGQVGFGEACPGYYFDETVEKIVTFLDLLDLQQFKNPDQIEAILEYVDSKDAGCTAAKASIDMALHDLQGKLKQKPCYSFFSVNPDGMPLTSYTLGMDTPDMIRKKLSEASGFKIIKVKLGGADDKGIIKTVREETALPITVDANQGWKSKEEALEMIHWLNEQNVLFIEQPMPKENWKEHGWLKARSPLPIIADEAVLRLRDIERINDSYDGFNIKMVKCTGMREGYLMIQRAKELGLKTMIGCMGESSNSILAAASIAPLCDWVDLDSPWLIADNPFEDPDLKEGKIILSDRPGLGLITRNRSYHAS